MTEAVLDKVRRKIPAAERKQGELLYGNNLCVLLSQSPKAVEFVILPQESNEESGGSIKHMLHIDEDEKDIIPVKNNKTAEWDRYAYACLLRYDKELRGPVPKEAGEYKRYTREGMIERVLEERRVKAENAQYQIQWASNIYGDHILTNERGIEYTVFLRDFENETGYSSSADSAYNKLGTTKHIMYAFNKLKSNKKLYDTLDKTFPFVELYCDPLRDYKISWFYPHELPKDEKKLITSYFDSPAGQFIEEKDVKKLLPFIEEAANYDNICIRPEVREKVERAYEESMLADLRKKTTPEFSCIKTELFPYQKEGIEFALFRRAAVIADEMGLGKTIQAIGTAVLKKKIFGFRKTLVVCPATLKHQWKKEIEKFTAEKALVVSGPPREREKQYYREEYFFFIINYETVLRDWQAINHADFDLLVLDEAQKIKNYETKTASAVKRIKTKHSLVITGTPIENRLIDIYSIINTIDPLYLGPLWEFSYKHCLFDMDKPNKINGYYDLRELNQRLSDILIRREKREVLSQLPFIQQRDVPVDLSPVQEEMHGGFMAGIAQIIHKKFLTPYDIQRLNLLLNNARMVCDSAFLIDGKTADSPKLLELEDILFEKLDIANNTRKVIVFSEWIKMHSLIGQMLRKRGIGFTELNGKVPVKARGELIKQFETDPDCRVFLSTEAGGAGLNLQAADILINFELPWNPAKKNQRIGRIDRLGQKSGKLTIYNLISRNSIEQQIAAGLLVKQSLFEGALSRGGVNYVDFSTKGRSQFIRQLEEMVKQQEHPETVPETAPVSQLLHAGEYQTEQLEEILNKGMEFLAVLFKMSTGNDLDIGGQKINVDKTSGEVSLHFEMKQANSAG